MANRPVNGEKLESLLREKGWTYPELVDKMEEFLEKKKPATKTISRWIKGGGISPMHLRALANTFGVSPTDLITPEALDKSTKAVLTFVTGVNEAEQALLDSSFEVYEELFPDVAERSDPEDIRDWLHESRNAEHSGDPWRDLWGVLHIGKRVLGIIFFSFHQEYPWVVGVYFGVRDGWRERDRAETFLEDAVMYLRGLKKEIKAIVFMVEWIEFPFLTDIALDVERIHFDERVLFNLRSIKRLKFYQHYHAYAVNGRDGLPLPCWMPSTEDDLSTSGERKMILMVKPIGETTIEKIEVQAILDFFYDVFYTEAYGSKIQGFRQYIAELKARIEAEAKEGWSVGKFDPLRISPNIRKLYDRVYKERIRLDL